MRGAFSAAALSLLATSRPAVGDALRLRGDAFYAAQAPVGLMQLQAEGREGDVVEAEALVWTGADSGLDGDDGADGDALVMVIRARDPKGRGEVRAGRFVVATGAVRPRHIDGALARGRSSFGTDVEAFGGVPVAPRFGYDAFDWLAGGRVSHHYGEVATAGVSFVHERDGGDLIDQEVGADVSVLPTKWLDVAGKAAFDTVNTGLAEGTILTAARHGAFRHQLRGTRRTPSRLLPATSLFTVLGDVPSDEVIAATQWRAAPRLDVSAEAGVREVAGETGAELSARGLLRLDDRGDGSLLLEGRRSELGPGSGWTGVRTALRLPVAPRTRASCELELAVPDDSRGRGTVWPWGLVALAHSPSEDWEAAAALEASASPEDEFSLSALVRISRRWGAR